MPRKSNWKTRTKTWARKWWRSRQQDRRLGGDGATTATVLAEAIYSQGLKLATAGANPISIQRGITRAVEAAVDKLTRFPRRSRTRRRSSKSPPFRPTGTPPSAKSSPTPWTRSARTAPSRLRKPSPSRRRSTWWKGCSLTKAISPPTSSPTPRRWKRSWRTPTS